MAGRRLLFKCELLQKTGSFKVRGDGGTAKPRGKGRSLQEETRVPPAPTAPAALLIPWGERCCPGLGEWCEENVQPCTPSPALSPQIRGALNAVRSLVEERQRTGRELPRAVVTHSSGNHGQALACAAQAEGIPAYIVVPRSAPQCKQDAIRAYGATLVPCDPSDKSRAETASRVVQETGGVLVHPNQELAVIAGQGTIALEVLEQAPQVNAVVVPVGGGGMVAGIAVTIKALRPDVKVFAAEPSNVDDCYQSKVRGELTPNLHPRDTIADAVKTSIGPNTWPIIRDLVDDVLTVSEEEIKRATWLVWERMKLLIEPTAGVGLAAVLSEQFQAVPRDVQNVCIVLCGGNVDLRSLTWLTDLSGKAE
ncbi:serine racemase isoform X1 [Camarhynchus parvulus]|uniref:serine racemase isoform X1 n=1 Tax=Geospiza parvula TaxID=87175 RepID=UPI0012381C6B|nr:serine racemase isoform X1 [Camarhynchus parvulus]